MNPGYLKKIKANSCCQTYWAFQALRRNHSGLSVSVFITYLANGLVFYFKFFIFAFDDKVINIYLTFLSTCPTDASPTPTVPDLKP